ncbi:hypothetical protein ABPG72_014304 [Tetrahymena utriculariae]
MNYNFEQTEEYFINPFQLEKDLFQALYLDSEDIQSQEMIKQQFKYRENIKKNQSIYSNQQNTKTSKYLDSFLKMYFSYPETQYKMNEEDDTYISQNALDDPIYYIQYGAQNFQLENETIINKIE